MSSNSALEVDQAPDTDEDPSTIGSASPDAASSPESIAGEGDVELSLDMTFEILKNERRRRVLEYLQEHDGPMELGTLAEQIAAWENDTTMDALTSSERKRVYVGLYQCHLPKMDDMDIVDFNRNRGLVELSDNADQLDTYLQKSTAATRPWHVYYGAVSASAAVLFIASQFALLPALLTPSLVTVVVIAAFALCALIHAAVVTKPALGRK